MKSKKKKKGPSLKNKNKLKKNTNVKSKSLNKKKIKKTKTRKIRYGRIFMFIIMPIFLLYVAFSFIDFPIKNIFISGNSILSDQDIIEILSLEDYPSIFKYSSLSLERKLEDNMYIKEAKVTKKKLKEIHITVVENKPIFYYAYSNKTAFSDKKLYDGELSNTVLINYVPKEKYNKLLQGLIDMDENVLKRISEIGYVPDDVNDERFLCTMADGNYVYITLGKISTMNSYLDIVKNFQNKKGYLYLDSGEYFEIKEN